MKQNMKQYIVRIENADLLATFYPQEPYCSGKSYKGARQNSRNVK